MTERPTSRRARSRLLPAWRTRPGKGRRRATRPRPGGMGGARRTGRLLAPVRLEGPRDNADRTPHSHRAASTSGARTQTPRSYPVEGKRRLPTGQRWPSRAFKTYVPSLVGAGAIALAAAGATLSSVGAAATVGAASPAAFAPASSYSGTSGTASSTQLASRQQAISRDSRRPSLQSATRTPDQAVEAQAQERMAVLARLADSAERYAEDLAANAWVLPLTYYRITATFGQTGSLWSSTHTGLDFAAASGTPVLSVAAGTVTSASYAGAYGNQVIVTLEDGTELWYNHLTSYAVGVGEQLQPGQDLGTVGATGNVTGPHLHLEVRPGAGDPVDPYAAFATNGLRP